MARPWLAPDTGLPLRKGAVEGPDGVALLQGWDPAAHIEQGTGVDAKAILLCPHSQGAVGCQEPEANPDLQGSHPGPRPSTQDRELNTQPVSELGELDVSGRIFRAPWPRRDGPGPLSKNQPHGLTPSRLLVQPRPAGVGTETQASVTGIRGPRACRERARGGAEFGVPHLHGRKASNLGVMKQCTGSLLYSPFLDTGRLAGRLLALTVAGVSSPPPWTHSSWCWAPTSSRPAQSPMRHVFSARRFIFLGVNRGAHDLLEGLVRV